MPRTTTKHLPVLDEQAREEVGVELQATLIELIALSLTGKQLHWSIVGRHFRELHLYLDELVASWQEFTDTVAERMVALGSWPDGQPDTVATYGCVDRVDVGALADNTVIDVLVKDLGHLADRTRRRMDRLGALDAASQDVLVELVRKLEEQLWMVRSQLS